MFRFTLHASRFFKKKKSRSSITGESTPKNIDLFQFEKLIQLKFKFKVSERRRDSDKCVFSYKKHLPVFNLENNNKYNAKHLKTIFKESKMMSILGLIS